ncbi:MAG: methylenetetrahydrofolate reductase [Candidatus Pacearchaeota archaeon]|nr:methylenetetrahydrofolate reductase [Candidatus Pacearchaeota archaeon]
MNNKHYLIELLTPKQKDIDKIDSKLKIFAERYERILGLGNKTESMVSIPDNPLGNLHFTAMETLEYLDLKLNPEKTLLHLNSFHRKQDLDKFLKEAADKSLKYLLIISGDGSPKLPRLEPSQLGIEAKTVTSIELLRYVNEYYQNAFITGVAFNQYEPQKSEIEKLEKKIEAGAKFITTQPVIWNDTSIEAIKKYNLPINLGCWMSNNIQLLYECVGIEKMKPLEIYNPMKNLKMLRQSNPESSIYLSLLSFKADWEKILMD